MVDITNKVEGFGSWNVGLGLRVEQLITILYATFLIPVAYLLVNDIRRRRWSVISPSGCTKLELKDRSHVRDEYDSKYDKGTTDSSIWKVKAIFIHPIKSCSPVELDVADVEAKGLTYDRNFAFAEWMTPTTGEDKTPRWIFRTLRTPGLEKLALVKPEVWVPNTQVNKGASNMRRVEKEGALVIKYPNVPVGPLAPLDRLAIRWGLLPGERSFRVPLVPSEGHHYKSEAVDIWKDQPLWLNMGEHVPADFKQWLGVKNPLSLFRADPKRYREVFRCAPRKTEVGYQPVVSFQDGYPCNLLNIASIHEIGNKIKDAIPQFSVKRFRGNFILEGPPAYDEDDWKKVKIGGHELYCACHCVRCRLPNVDPDTSERHPVQPDKELKSSRCIDEGDPKNACMGLQLVPANDKLFQIKVGDAVEVLKRGEHRYIKN